jgi:hypothetical protein
MTAAGALRGAVQARAPESASWLALYDVARAALDAPAWDAAVPAPGAATPFIDGTTLGVDPAAAARLVGAIVRGAGGTAPDADDTLALLEAGIVEDEAGIAAGAARTGLTTAVAGVAAALAAMPLLHACRRAWAARVPDTWIDAACPVCGTWAALVEARGLERTLRHRCARCGADWAAEPVRCGFCGIRAHEQLTALVAERADERGRVEACGGCGAYVKSVTTLTATPAADLALLDLDTVHLDVAAIEHAFRRPPARPRRVTVRGVRPPRFRGLFGGGA